MNFLFKLLKGASFAKCSRALELVRQRSGKGKCSTLLDMLLCTLRYGAGYHDYALFGFERLTAAQRDTYVTRIRNKRILDRMNKKEFFDEFNDKTRFLTHFSQYLGRDFLLLPADGKALSAFLQKYPSFFAKPSRGCGGRGILHLNRTDFPSEAALMQFLTEKGLSILEAPITQHPRMAALHPQSVNTLRIVTDRVDGQVYIAYVLLKVGRGDAFCDNTGQGGMFCRVDRKSGCVCSVAVDDDLKTYESHPDTGMAFMGYQVPYFSQALALARAASAVVPEIGHIGWDIAITPHGAVVVEGNPDPGVMCQTYPLWKNEDGLWPFYRRILRL